MKNICVYCGSNYGSLPIYELAARTLGQALALSGRTLVYGGGRLGLMGVVADECLKHGGCVIGVIPEVLIDQEQAHPGLTSLEVVPDMSARKARMIALADGFIALPGGLGTYEELFEVLSWTQIGLLTNPIGILNVNDFYLPLLALLEHTVSNGFMRAKNQSLYVVDQHVSSLLTAMESNHPQLCSKWLPRGSVADPLEVDTENH